MADAVEKRRSPFAKQVMLANLVIVAGFVGVLVLFAYLVSTRSAANRWSSYKPTGSDVYDKAQNTADHVAPAYKYNGQPIAVVQAQPLLYQDAVVDGIGITRQPLPQDRELHQAVRAAERDDHVRHVRQPPTSAGSRRWDRRRRSRSCAGRRSSWPCTPSSTRRTSTQWWPCSVLRRATTTGAIYLRRKNLADELSKPLDDDASAAQGPELRRLSQVENAPAYCGSPGTIVQLALRRRAPNGRTLLVLRSVDG